MQSLSPSAIALTADDAKVSRFLRDLFDTLMFRNCDSSRICLNFLLPFLLGLKMDVILEVYLVKLCLKILKAFVTKELKWIFSRIVKIMLWRSQIISHGSIKSVVGLNKFFKRMDLIIFFSASVRSRLKWFHPKSSLFISFRISD